MEGVIHAMIRVFPDLYFDSFNPQNLVLNPQKSGGKVLSDAYKVNQKLILFIYGFAF